MKSGQGEEYTYNMIPCSYSPIIPIFPGRSVCLGPSEARRDSQAAWACQKDAWEVAGEADDGWKGYASDATRPHAKEDFEALRRSV